MKKLWHPGEDFKNGEQYSGRVHKPSYPELDFGTTEDGSLGFAHSAKEASEMGFYAINVDSMFWSLLTGLIFCTVFKNGCQ